MPTAIIKQDTALYNPSKKRKFKTVKQLEIRIAEYFEYCRKKKKIPTVTLLALFLDTSRKVLMNYQNDPNFREYGNTLLKAKALIEHYAEELLYVKHNPAGVIFGLKNNYDWKDKIEHVTSGEVNINIHRDENLELIELARIFALNEIKVGRTKYKTIDITPKIEGGEPPEK